MSGNVKARCVWGYWIVKYDKSKSPKLISLGLELL